GPCREVVPARTARGLRIRRYHRYSLADQVAPVLDVLRVALANQENNGRCVRRGMLRQTRLPVDGQQLAVVRDRVDVRGQRQRDHVGRQAVDHRARLAARAAVRLVDGDRVAGLLLPVLGEGFVEVDVQLAGRIIRDVEQRDVPGGGLARAADEDGGGECEQQSPVQLIEF